MPDNENRQRIVDSARALPPDERAAFVERACGGDQALRAEIEALLAAPSIGDVPTIGLPVATTGGAPGEALGTQIGPYKLLQLIGEGGFGSVYMAEQIEPVKRRVALKLIKLGMDTRRVVARFEQERQALAMMDHPCIARVLDAGTTPSGGPYFVMDLVKGEPITAYCDRNNLPISERLALFVQVCSAVQHAHTKGIIHRDLKPSNVLVATLDGAPTPKVIDFGIAKAIASNLTDKTLFTEHRSLLGTPEYMSPEQAEGSLDIDTRTDVYSLGVLFYELLTGSTPFPSDSLRSAPIAEIQRIIRDVDPPSPSTRLSRSTETLPRVAASRRTEPAKLGAAIKGDLDWVVMKALDKDRQRRYETASALALDVRRYLAGEAVLAAPPSAAYRLRKFVSRHRTAVAAASIIAAALVLGVIGVAWQASVARNERDRAEVVAAFMADTLQGVGPSVARGRDSTMLKEMMDEAAAKIAQGSLSNAPAAELSLRGTIGSTYRELALFDEALAMLEPTVPLARSLFPGDHRNVAQALTDLAGLLSDRGDFERAEPLYRDALLMYQRLQPGDDADVATALNNLADLLDDRGDTAAAEQLCRQALDMRRRLFHGDHAEIAESLNNLAGHVRERDPSEAERLFREALDMNRRLYPGDHPRVAAGLNNLSVLLKNLGNDAGAEALARETLDMRRRLYPGDHPAIATGIGNLALLIQDRGDLAAAEPLFRESLAMRRRLYPEGHASVATDLANLGRLLLARGDAVYAEPAYREAVTLYERAVGEKYWPTANARIGLGRTLGALKRFGEAERELLAAERVLAMDGMPPARRERCVEALVELYTAWDKAEAGKGHDADAAKWKATLSKS